MPRRRRIAVAASGSVGETIAPARTRPPTASRGPLHAPRRRPDRRQQHQPDRVHRDHPHLRAEVAQGAEVGEVEQQRRQEDQQDDVRVQRHVGHARREADQAPAHDERDRVGDVERPCGRGEHRDRDQQEEDDELDVVHPRARILPPRIARCTPPPTTGPSTPTRSSPWPPSRCSASRSGHPHARPRRAGGGRRARGRRLRQRPGRGRLRPPPARRRGRARERGGPTRRSGSCGAELRGGGLRRGAGGGRRGRRGRSCRASMPTTRAVARGSLIDGLRGPMTVSGVIGAFNARWDEELTRRAGARPLRRRAGAGHGHPGAGGRPPPRAARAPPASSPTRSRAPTTRGSWT